MRSLLIALRCLTIFPAGQGNATDERMIARSRLWYPAVGVAIGLLVGLAGAVAFRWLPDAHLAAAITVAIWVLVTGALHLDGLADSCDGVFAHGDRQRRLEIMHDPHVGTFGMVAVVLCLLIKTFALGSLDPERVMPTLLAAAIAGRSAILIVAGLCSYPHAMGTGKIVIAAAGWHDCAWAAAWMFVAGALLNWPVGVLASAGAVAGSVLWAALCRGRLGGATGDCLGAACELSEAIFLTIAAIVTATRSGVQAEWLGILLWRA